MIVGTATRGNPMVDFGLPVGTHFSWPRFIDPFSLEAIQEGLRAAVYL